MKALVAGVALSIAACVAIGAAAAPPGARQDSGLTILRPPAAPKGSRPRPGPTLALGPIDDATKHAYLEKLRAAIANNQVPATTWRGPFAFTVDPTRLLQNDPRGNPVRLSIHAPNDVDAEGVAWPPGGGEVTFGFTSLPGAGYLLDCMIHRYVLTSSTSVSVEVNGTGKLAPIKDNHAVIGWVSAGTATTVTVSQLPSLAWCEVTEVRPRE